MNPLLKFSLAAFVAGNVVLSSPAANAQSLSWTSAGNVTLGGSGTWDTTSSLWWNGVAATTWGNLTTSDAVFSGTAGTVTLGEAITVNDMAFNATGYILSGANTLTLAGTTPTITVGSGLSAIIGANTATVLAGTAGLTKAGAGTLTINGTAANTFTGGVNVNGGTLVVNMANMATPTNLINSGNALSLSGGTLNVIGKTGATAGQTFNGTTVRTGYSTVIANGAGNTTTTALGTVSQSQVGGVLSLQTVSGGVINVSNPINTPLGSWAVTGDATSNPRWAFVSGTGAITSMTNNTTLGTNLSLVTSATTAYNITGSTSNTLAADVTAYGLLVNNANVSINTNGRNVTTDGIITLTSGLTVSGNGSLRAGSGNELVIVGASAVNVSANITNGAGGNSNLTYNGGSTLTLTGNNSYSGQTTVNTGNVVVGTGGSINNTSGVVINGGAFRYNNAATALTANTTLNGGTLTGTGAVTLGAVNVANNSGAIITNNNGAAGAALTVGNLSFNGAATLNFFLNSTSPALIAAGLSTNSAGVVTINPVSNTGLWSTGSVYSLLTYTGGSIGGAGFGQFSLGTVAGLTSRQSTVLGNSGSAITLTINGDNPYWTGGTNGDWNTTQTGNWKLVTAGTDTTFINGDEVHFTDNSTGTTTVNITENVSTTAVLFNNTTKDYTIGSSGGFGITSAVSLTKNGTGNVTLSSNNTYAGATNINDGALRVQGGNGIGDSSVVTTANVATAQLQVLQSETIAGLSGGGATGGNVVLSAGQNLTISGSTPQTFAGAITGDGGLVLSGSANQTVTGGLTYTGGTLLNAGTRLGINRSDTVNFNSALTGNGTLALLGSGSVVLGTSNTFNGTVTLANTVGNTLDLGNLNQTIGALSGGNATGGTVAIGSGNLTIRATTNQTYNGRFTGTGDLIVNALSPNATVSFGGDNTGASTAFTGNVRVQSGIMILGKTANIFGTNSAGLGTQSILVSNGGIARLAYGNAGYDQRQNFVLNGTGADGLGALQALDINFGAGPSIGGIVAESDTLVRVTRNGTAGAQALFVRNSLAGSGNLTFNGGGGTRPGIIQLSVASGNLTLGGTTYNTYSGNLTVTGNATLIANAANALGNARLVTVDANSTLQLNAGSNQTIGGLGGAGLVNLNANTLTIGGDNSTSSFGGNMSGTGGNLVKNGTGSLTLSAANSFTGSTTITEGTLILSSTGSIASSTIGFGVKDASNGLLTVQNTGFSFSGNLTLDLAAVTVSTGSWTLFNGFAFDAADLSLANVTSNLAGLSFTNSSGVWSGTDLTSREWTFTEDTGVLQVVPEPSTWALVGLGLGLVLFFRRRKNVA